MYRYLLFDLDGTLTDSAEGITRSVDHALRTAAGITTDDLSTLTPYIGPPLIDGFMENHHLDYDTAVRCKQAYRERYQKIGMFENRVYDGIPDALDRLRQAGRVLAVATSKPEEYAVRILEHFGLQDRFVTICGATMDGRISQKDEVICEALRRLGSPDPEQVMMIGDRRHDVLGAEKHGLRTLGVLFGFGTAEDLRAAGAYALAQTPAQMADWLLAQP